MTKTDALSSKGLVGINSRRLFVGSCLALISTSVIFGVMSAMIGDLKTIFALSNTEAGWIRGAANWGFAFTIIIFGPLCDAIGMGRLLRFSFVGHILGPLLMILAQTADNPFWMLFSGALIVALANGTVEAVCNPLVATIFPDQKTQKLNQFHMWFPGGIVIGGLLAFLIDRLPSDLWNNFFLASWQIKLALVFVPTFIYGFIFTGQKFPATERVQSGVSFLEMFKETFFRPLFIVLFLSISLTASLELGPNNWMAEVMKKAMSFAGDNAGILVLVYGCTLMAILRYYAGPVIHKLSPTGVLFVSVILAGLGLTALTFAVRPIVIFLSATIFYFGVCYCWPTILGVAAERVPKGGALALSLLTGWGMLVVGLITVPIMGWITDLYGHTKLPPQQTISCLVAGSEKLTQIQASEQSQNLRNIDKAIALVQEVTTQIEATDRLPKIKTAKALREIVRYAPETEMGRQAQALIKPADDYGGIISFRYVAALSVILVLIFGTLFIRDRAQGGYKVEKLK